MTAITTHATGIADSGLPEARDLEARLAELAARAELTDLVSRLGAALDEHRFDDLRELFTDDATATTPGGTAEGRDSVVAQATRNHVGVDRLQHVLTNVLVDLDGPDAATGATVRANLIAHFASADGVPEQTIGGVYRFRVRATPAGWRIAALQVAPVWRAAGVRTAAS